MHRVTREGQSENLPAIVTVSAGKDSREFHMDRVSKPFVFALQEVVKKEYKESPGEVSQLVVEVQLVPHTTPANWPPKRF